MFLTLAMVLTATAVDPAPATNPTMLQIGTFTVGGDQPAEPPPPEAPRLEAPVRVQQPAAVPPVQPGGPQYRQPRPHRLTPELPQ